MNFVRKLYMLTNRKLTKKRIIAAAEQLTEARFALSRLDQTAIPEIAKSFIRQTYYIAPDIGEWAQAVDSVSCRHPKSIAENAPQVLLMGSPVYFLNTAAWN
ncbi:MAG: hypothetical protein EOM14_09440 [Clostridia bacterium]|nr:hypothetical protein [Clostridia bacterium]